MDGRRIPSRPNASPSGRRAEDIATVEGVSPLDVEGWLIAAEDLERRRIIRTSAISVALGGVLLAGLFLSPAEWRNATLDTSPILFAASAFFAAAAVIGVVLQLRVRRWRPAQARIVATSIARRERLWMPAVFYDYVVDGATYTAHRVHVTGPVSDARGADRHRRRYEPGDLAICYHPPRHAGRAVLERGLALGGARFMLFLAGICGLLGVLL